MSYSPWGRRELDTTEQLTLLLFSSRVGSKDHIPLESPQRKGGHAEARRLSVLGFLVMRRAVSTYLRSGG